MRIAVMSDIHGNSIALEAVLHDIKAQGAIDGYWILGDVVALGHDPVVVLERLTGLAHVQFARGNTDRYVCTGDRPPPTLEQAQQDPNLLPILVEVAGTFAWTQGAVTNAGWLDWLGALPLELRCRLPHGIRMLGVHASPGSDDVSIHPSQSQAELERLLADCRADLIFVGHTHVPMDVRVNGRRVVNVGSVSNPLSPDLRASYILLDADEMGHHIEFRRVDYDREAVIAALERIRHPGLNFIVRHMQGRVKPSLPGPHPA